MAKKSQAGRKVEGWKAKAWYKIHVPEVFGKSYIGDTISSDPATVQGRILQTTLGEIIQDYTKQHIKIRVKVTSVALLVRRAQPGGILIENPPGSR